MNLDNLILSQHQYVTAKKSVPYEYLLRTTTGQEIVALGVFHSKPSTKHIVTLWDEFVKYGDAMIALTEGQIRTVPKTLTEAVARRGEIDVVQWLAHKSNVDVIFPEPTNEEVVMSLQKKFDPDDIAFSAIASRMSSHERTLPGLSSEAALERILAEHASLSHAYGFTPSMLWFQDVFHQRFGQQSIEDKAFWNSIYDPFSEKTIFNRISAARSQLRDISILHAIIKYWKEGKSIFFVYGHAHVVKLEPALRQLTGFNL